MTTTYHVPAFSQREAVEIAQAARDGRLAHREHYLDAEAAERVCAHLNRLSHAARRVYIVTLVDADASQIGIGDVAAAVMLFVIAPTLMASFWGLLA